MGLVKTGNLELKTEDYLLADRPGDAANVQFGRYLVGDQLGSGGGAKVFRAFDQIQERYVALKMLSADADASVLARFRREARTVAILRHPHIVQTFQVGDGENEDGAYIAMELVEGESLAQLLKRRGRLGAAESCNLLAPVARALEYAHQQEIVHRDVKPSNILLRPASSHAVGGGGREGLAASAVQEAEQILVGDPVGGAPGAETVPSGELVAPLLSDFGIARALDMPELTNEGRTIGTPAYMAPEQCAGSREATGRADIYSLGAVFYRCLVGRAPFTGSTTQILHAHVYSPLAIPNDLRAALPAELLEFLRRSLAKDPEMRFASAGEMADRLIAAAARIQLQESSFTEQTSTLTLVTLPSVQLPPSRPHSTDSVIVPGRESRTSPSAPDDIPASGPEPGSELPGSLRARWSRARLTATVAGSILVLALVALIGPAARSGGVLGSDFSVLGSGAEPEGVGEDAGAAENAEQTTEGYLAVDAGSTAAAAPGARAPSSAADPEPGAAPDGAGTAREPPPGCQYQAAEVFGPFFDLNQELGRELGCPKNVPTSPGFEVQQFQTGMAIGRLDRPTVYIRYFTNDEWEQREHSWRDGMPEAASEAPDLQAPDDGLFQPLRGIGRVWAENLFVRQALGWASDQPQAFSGVLQSFEGGLLIYNNSTRDTYILLKSQLRL